MFGDILFDNHLPITTPTRLELINATELPIKTIIGFPDSADNISVAIWVLSPNSAIKIVVKVVINIVEKLFSTISLSSILITIIVSIFPALKAAKLDPVQSLKYE